MDEGEKKQMDEGEKKLLDEVKKIREGIAPISESSGGSGVYGTALNKLTEITELFEEGDAVAGSTAQTGTAGAVGQTEASVAASAIGKGEGAQTQTDDTATAAVAQVSAAAATAGGVAAMAAGSQATGNATNSMSKASTKGTDNMSDANEVLSQMKEKEVKYVDLRFSDPRGKLQHLTMDAALIGADEFTDGVPFDGSSIGGWKAINESDMLLMPDPASAHIDPFYGQKTMAIFCDILEPLTGERYDRDPRGTARKAEAYLQSTGLGDAVYFGPEPEFFMFDDVRFASDPYNTSFRLDDAELPSNSDRAYESGNLGHRPRMKGGYFPVNPIDSAQDIRSEMLAVMNTMGVVTEKHHHEVASAQHELGIKFDELTKAADNVQVYKYVVHNVAEAYGKTATFMPKPVFGDNGTGMHCHQSIFKAGAPVFAGNMYADLSQECLHYIGGILKHAKALNAFTNPSTNSYKRLVPGYEAPVLLAYSARNRSASCRIPHVANPKGKRVEIRFPDPTANPYLAFAAMLMAGLDGIENKIDPGDAMDKDLYDLPPAELSQIPTVCGSLREAMASLDADRAFLTKGGVFTDDQINAYLGQLKDDADRYDMTPHPVEFDMYYSA